MSFVISKCIRMWNNYLTLSLFLLYLASVVFLGFSRADPLILTSNSCYNDRNVATVHLRCPSNHSVWVVATFSDISCTDLLAYQFWDCTTNSDLGTGLPRAASRRRQLSSLLCERERISAYFQLEYECIPVVSTKDQKPGPGWTPRILSTASPRTAGNKTSHLPRFKGHDLIIIGEAVHALSTESSSSSSPNKNKITLAAVIVGSVSAFIVVLVVMAMLIRKIHHRTYQESLYGRVRRDFSITPPSSPSSSGSSPFYQPPSNDSAVTTSAAATAIYDGCYGVL